MNKEVKHIKKIEKNVEIRKGGRGGMRTGGGVVIKEAEKEEGERRVYLLL